MTRVIKRVLIGTAGLIALGIGIALASAGLMRGRDTLTNYPPTDGLF
jgi:hypothetical protein